MRNKKSLIAVLSLVVFLIGTSSVAVAVKPAKHRQQSSQNNNTFLGNDHNDREGTTTKRSKRKRRSSQGNRRQFQQFPGIDLSQPFGQQPVESDDSSGVSGGLPSSDQDWLARNGLISPTCKSALAGKTRVDARTMANCNASGSTAFSADADHYEIDTHIDTGFFKPEKSIAAVIHFLVSAGWRILVAVTQLLVVLLEWVFGFDLLDPTKLGKLAEHLRTARDNLSLPLLRIAMVCGAVWFAYVGIFRSQVARAVGGFAQSMVLSGVLLLLLANPIGLVSQTINMVDRGALGLLALANFQEPHRGEATFRDGLKSLVRQTIVPAWSLIEFGDVDWATNPKHKSPELTAAARTLAEEGTKEQKTAVRVARTNADLFLAFPANSPARNSINNDKSVYRVLFGNKICDEELSKYDKARNESAPTGRVMIFNKQ